MILRGPKDCLNLPNFSVSRGFQKFYNIPLFPRNYFDPPTMVAVVPEFKDRVDISCESGES